VVSGRTIRPAQRAWDQQQAFVSNASHELRTPLAILRATAELNLKLGGKHAEEGLRSVVEETDYMNALVDDLLLLSRLDARR
jgi:signal transduction histidine kinase